MKSIVALIALLFLIIPAAACAQDESRETIVPGAPPASTTLPPITISAAPRAQPIAVSALKNLGGDDAHRVSESFGKVLMRDLTLSSFFRILNPAAYIEDAQNSGYDIGQFNFGDWSSLGADYLVKGSATRDGDTVKVEALLFDVPQQRRVMGKKFTGSPHDVGEMARRFADEILKSATGKRGPFDSKLAFVSTRGGRFKEVYTSWLDGGSLFRVTDNPTINLFPDFSHDVSHLLYLSYKSYSPELYLADLDRQIETRINPGLGQAVGGTMAPDGQIVASYQRGGRTNLYLLTPSGNLVHALTDNSSINVSPSVCPDGDQLVFTSDRSGTPQVYSEDLDGGNAHRVTYKGSYNTTPAFSPDCKQIAYESREPGGFQIYVINLDGSGAQRLTQSGSNEGPTWSPDGRYIAFSSNRGGGSRIYLMRARDGYIIAPLTEGQGNESNPAWSWWMGD